MSLLTSEQLNAYANIFYEAVQNREDFIRKHNQQPTEPVPEEEPKKKLVFSLDELDSAGNINNVADEVANRQYLKELNRLNNAIHNAFTLLVDYLNVENNDPFMDALKQQLKPDELTEWVFQEKLTALENIVIYGSPDDWQNILNHMQQQRAALGQ